jgi:hypothetical protein
LEVWEFQLDSNVFKEWFMNKLKYSFVGIFLLVVLISGCKKTCMDDFEKLSEKLGENGGGGCFSGSWYSDACGDPRGVIWNFNADGTGSSSNPDCNGICGPLVFTFTYNVSGSTCYLDFDAQQPVVYCTGYDPLAPNSPPNSSFTFECDGSSLTVNYNGDSWTMIR